MPRLRSPKLLMKRAVPPSFTALAVGDDCPARRRCRCGCHAGDRDVEPVAAVGDGGGIDGAGAGGDEAPGGYESFGKGAALFEVGEDDDVVRYSGRGVAWRFGVYIQDFTLCSKRNPSFRFLISPQLIPVDELLTFAFSLLPPLVNRFLPQWIRAIATRVS